MLKKLSTLLFLLPLFTWAQHTITGKFSPAKDFEIAILYKVTPTQLVYENHSKLDVNGLFSIPIKANAEKGMYKIVYAMPQEEFNFDLIYNNEDINLTFSLEKGVSFLVSEENKILESYKKSMGLISQSIDQFFKKNATNETDFLKLIAIQKKTQNEYETAAANKVALQFIKANRPYFPETYLNEDSYKKELKAHYFDAIDFGNLILLNSNALVEKSFSYVYSYVNVNAMNNSYKQNIDVLVKQMENTKDFKTLILELLWREFSKDNDDVANYISNTYLLHLAKAKNNTPLVNEIQQFTKSTLGTKAPDFKINDTTLYSLNTAENYIVVFWSSTCGHCLNEMPILNAYIKSQQKNKFKVIAIGLEDTPEFWTEKIKEFKEFTHIYGEGKWDNKIGNDYNVNSTPSYYVLDKHKKIIAKPYDVNALKARFIPTSKI